MSRAILIDMNPAPDWKPPLVATGLHAVHWSKVGDRHATQQMIMQRVTTHEHVVLTHDLDFGAPLAATNASRPNAMLIRSEDTFVEGIGTRIARAILQYADELRAGAMVVFDPAKLRLRLLPLQTTK